MKRLLIITALLTIWTSVAFAQKTFGWEVYKITIREGRTEAELNNTRFPRGDRPPEGQEHVVMNLPFANGLPGWVSLGEDLIVNFYDYNTDNDKEGHIGIDFKSENNLKFVILFGVNDDERFQDVMFIKLDADGLITEYMYTLKRTLVK